MLSPEERVFEEAERRLAVEFGAIDLKSQVLTFNFTDYYEEEMGKGILRKFLSFEGLVEPGDLAQIKLFTNHLEKDFQQIGRGRPINLDPGYVTGSKLVLASTKDYSHRLYLGQGIYGEVTLRYVKGSFEPLPWTYPDYRTGGYLDFFSEVRRSYLEKLKRRPTKA